MDLSKLIAAVLLFAGSALVETGVARTPSPGHRPRPMMTRCRSAYSRDRQVDEAVFVRIENALAIISALCDVVRQTHSNHSGNSGHLKMVVRAASCSQKSGFEVSVPGV